MFYEDNITGSSIELSLRNMLLQHNEVMGVDISMDRVDILKAKTVAHYRHRTITILG